jgi:hypothetical protein
LFKRPEATTTITQQQQQLAQRDEQQQLDGAGDDVSDTTRESHVTFVVHVALVCVVAITRLDNQVNEHHSFTLTMDG